MSSFKKKMIVLKNDIRITLKLAKQDLNKEADTILSSKGGEYSLADSVNSSINFDNESKGFSWNNIADYIRKNPKDLLQEKYIKQKAEEKEFADYLLKRKDANFILS